MENKLPRSQSQPTLSKDIQSQLPSLQKQRVSKRTPVDLQSMMKPSSLQTIQSTETNGESSMIPPSNAIYPNQISVQFSRTVTKKFDSTSSLLRAERQNQQKIIREHQKTAAQSMFQQVTSVSTKPQDGNVFFATGQANFLKAYSTKVRWMPQSGVGPQNQNDQKQIRSMKELRQASIHQTINQVKQFTFSEHNIKDNQYFTTYIDQNINHRIQQSIATNQRDEDSLEKEKKEHYYKSDIKQDFKSGATSQSMLSEARTPAGGDQESITAFHDRKPSTALEVIGEINTQELGNIKMAKIRTTSNLKALMKTAQEIKRDSSTSGLHKNPSTVADILTRSDLAADLILRDKFFKSTTSGFHHQKAFSMMRDVSYKEEPGMKHSQVLGKDVTMLATSQPSMIDHGRQKEQKVLTNLANFPKSLEKLQNLTVAIDRTISHSQSQSVLVPSNKLIKKELVDKVSDQFFLSPTNQRVNSVGFQAANSKNEVGKAAKINVNSKDYLMTKYSDFQHLQSILTQDIHSEKMNEEQQTELYRQRELELMLSLEKLNLSSRVDTIALQEWMTQMLEEVEVMKSKLEIRQRFEYTQLIYNLTFVELARQVSMHCTERGSLLNHIWSAFLGLMNHQLKLMRVEKFQLERETIISLDRFNTYYEKQLNDYKESVLKMYKETQNYKRSYDRILKDFEDLRAKTQRMGQQMQEITTLYKQKCSKLDILQRTNNNLTSIIQSMNEASEDEDPNMAEDEYFKSENPKMKHAYQILDEINRASGGGAISPSFEFGEKKSDPNELGFFSAQNQDDQFQLIDAIGKELGGFLETTEGKRNKESNALINAEQFVTQMKGEFFEERAIGTQGEFDLPSNEFIEYLVDFEYLKHSEQQVGPDLIILADQECWVNEDIILQDTGIDVREGENALINEKLREIQEHIAYLKKELEESKDKLELQVLLNDLQRDQLAEKEQQLSETTSALTLAKETVEEQTQRLSFLMEQVELNSMTIQSLEEQVNERFQENCRLVANIKEKDDLIANGLGTVEDLDEMSSSRRMSKIPSSMMDTSLRRKHKKNSSLGGGVGGRAKFMFNEFSLGKRKDRSSRAHPSTLIFDKFKKKGKIESILPKASLMKLITQVYAELSDVFQKTHRLPPLSPYIYDSMMHKYGIKKIGKEKYKQLLGTVYKMAPSCLRISIFGRLLKLVKPVCDASELKTYIYTFSFLVNLNIGVKVDNQESDEQHYTPYVRGQECLRQAFEGKIPIDEWTDLRKRFDALKKSDPKNVNKHGLVEVDAFIELVLAQYRRLENMAAEKAFELYQAIDFNGNAFISLDEFSNCYRNVVQGNQGKEYAFLLFQDYVEEAVDPETNQKLYGIGFDSFLHLALEFDILKVKDQNAFLIPLNIEKQYQDMISTLKRREIFWIKRLQYCKIYNDEWKENLMVLHQQVKEESVSKRILLLRCKLIEEESQQLVIDQYTDDFLPQDLQALIRWGVEDSYQNDFASRNIYSKEQVIEKKKIAGLHVKPVQFAQPEEEMTKAQ